MGSSSSVNGKNEDQREYAKELGFCKNLCLSEAKFDFCCYSRDDVVRFPKKDDECSLRKDSLIN